MTACDPDAPSTSEDDSVAVGDRKAFGCAPSSGTHSGSDGQATATRLRVRGFGWLVVLGLVQAAVLAIVCFWPVTGGMSTVARLAFLANFAGSFVSIGLAVLFRVHSRRVGEGFMGRRPDSDASCSGQPRHSSDGVHGQTARANRFMALATAYLLSVSAGIVAKGLSADPVYVIVQLNIGFASEGGLWIAMEYTLFGLLEGRLRLTEAGVHAKLGSRAVRCIRRVHLVVEVVVYYLVTIPIFNILWFRGRLEPFFAYYWREQQLHSLFTAVCHMVVGYACFCGYSTVLRSMAGASLPPGSYARREKDWAGRVMQILRWTTTLQCVCVGGLHLYLVVSTIRTGPLATWAYEVVYPVGCSVLTVLEIAGVLVLTGALRPRRCREFAPARSCSRVKAAECRTEPWRATTRSLAGRGISVRELLDLFELLGRPDGPMPHYRPEASTTNDVVRQAIIPLSRLTGEPGGAAYASLLRPRGGGPMPRVMVTHTWSGLFVDLVAAVVVHAIGGDEYGATATALASGECADLRGALQQHGALDGSLWICACSVNQHAGICGGCGEAPAEGTPHYARWDRGRRDTVTGEVFATCDCSQRKLFNDTSPEECEMNKFDDMIELLSSEVPGFAQLVVVDRGYDVFTRAWCVAELHRAHFLGLQQRVCLEANRVLDVDVDDLSDYWKLSALSVTSCEASRPQDKEEILGRIADTREFDEQLQEVIFGTRGLLRHQVEGFGVLEAAARTAFRVAMFGNAGQDAA